MDIFIENPLEIEELKRKKYHITPVVLSFSIDRNQTKWLKVAEATRDLTLGERLLLASKVFFKTVLTLGLGLLSPNLRKEWYFVWSGTDIKILYAEGEVHKQLQHEFNAELDRTASSLFEEKVSKELRKNPKHMLDSIRHGRSTVRQADKSLKKDPEFMLEVLKLDPNATEYIHRSLKSNPDFILEAMKINPHILSYYTSESLLRNDVFMLKAIQQDPNALIYAHQNLRDSRIFTLQAMETNGLALAHVKKNFKEDHSIVMAALANNGLALKDANHFRKSHCHVLVAVQQNPAAYEFADDSLKRDPKILAAANCSV